MIDACDPDADLTTLRKLIKLNTGENIKLTKDEICQVYKNIQDEKLPLPPLILNREKTYMTDRKSPLSVRDFEKLFDSSTKLSEIKRLARKVKLDDVDKKSKGDLITAIGKRLRHLKIAEPIKISRKRVITKKVIDNRIDLNSAMNTSEKRNNLSNFGNDTVKGNGNNRNNTGNVGNNRNTGNTRNNQNNTGNNRNNGNAGNGNNRNNGNTGNIGNNRNNTGNNRNNGNTGNIGNNRNNTGNNRNNGNSGNIGNVGNTKNNRNTKVNFPNESIFKSQPRPKFLNRSNSAQTNKVRFGNVFKRSTPSFLRKRSRRRRNDPYMDPYTPIGPGPDPYNPNVPIGPGPRPNIPVGPIGPGPRPNIPVGPPMKPKRSMFGGIFGGSAKSTLKKKLKTLKKLRSDEVNMFLARVTKPENIDDIFEQARLRDQQRYTEESERVEKKIKNAKTDEERRAALNENRRIKREKASANLQARKNLNILKKEERRLNISSKAEGIKNAKQALRRNLDTLKQLTRSEKNSFLPRVRAVENIDDVFASASALDQKRYEQKIQNAELKASRARSERERREAKREKNRLEREQLQEEKKARLKVKQLRNQTVRNKLNNTRAKQKMEKINANSITKSTALQGKTREKQLRTAKNSLKRNLASLKKLSSSEKTSYISRVRTLENIDDVFAEAQRLDQERYDQQLANLKKKNSLTRNERERTRLAKESRRVVKEQQNAKIRSTSNLKRMRELERKYKDEERRQNIINRKREKRIRDENMKPEPEPMPAPEPEPEPEPEPTPKPNIRNKMKRATRKIGMMTAFKKAGNNARQRRENTRNKMKRATRKIGMMSAFKKAGNNARQRRENLTGFISDDDDDNVNENVKSKESTTFNNPVFNKPQNKLKKAVRKIGMTSAFKKAGNNARQRKENLTGSDPKPFNARSKFKGAVGKIGAMKAFNTKKNNFNAAAELNKQLNIKAKEMNKPKPFNARSKFKGAVGKIGAMKAFNTKKKNENNFNATAELNKQLNIKAQELNKANTDGKVREGVEFKLKQIDGLTNADVSEFMKKWNKTKSQKIFNAARKRGAGKLAGKGTRNQRGKKVENDEKSATEASRLFNAGGDVKDLTRGKDERGVDPELLKVTREIIPFYAAGRRREAFLKKGRRLPSSRPVIEELKERKALRNKFQQVLSNKRNARVRKQLLNLVENANKPINVVRKAVNDEIKKRGTETDAATKIQAAFRGKRNRDKVTAMKEKEASNVSKSLVAGAINKVKKDEAATKLQAAFRGKKNRNKVRAMKKEKEASNASKSLVAGAINKVKKDEAATKLQAAFRGKKNRNKVRGMKKEKEAATKIQAAFRGKKNRNKVARMKFEKKTNVTDTFVPTGFDQDKVFNNPLARNPRPTPTPPIKKFQKAGTAIQGAVRRAKEKKTMNAVKAAAKIARDQKNLEKATPTQRRVLARKQSAEMDRNKRASASAAAGLIGKKAQKKQNRTEAKRRDTSVAKVRKARVQEKKDSRKEPKSEPRRSTRIAEARMQAEKKAKAEQMKKEREMRRKQQTKKTQKKRRTKPK